MLKSSPDSVDVSDLQFKLQCRLKVFENADISFFSNTNSLLTCASRYGLLFVGSDSNHFQVIQTNVLQKYSPKDKDVAEYPRRNIEIPSVAKHLCVNSDNTIIAVVVEKDQCPIVIFYEVLSFLRPNVNIIKEVRLSSTPGVYIKEISWNPSLLGVFTACKSDGSLGIYELKGDSIDINELPVEAGATCFCWSPKGKQIAVGSKDGKITQYKPDLKAVKVISEPKLEGPHSIISLQWVSNYQFIGVYHSLQNGSSFIIVVDAPKTGEPTFTNYDDICYSGSTRSPQFYLILQQAWNFLMIASANSTEVGVLGNNGESWTQWIMADTARAELPLTPDHLETLPVGLTFDISSTTPLPWGESTIPPCPMLCILSTYGVLCCFNVVYLKESIPSICTPPDPVADTTGLSSFVTNSASKKNIVDKQQENLRKPFQPEFKLGVASVQPQFGGTPSKDSAFPTPVALGFPSQSTPLVTGKGPDVASKALFGGQTTLTPIKSQVNQNMPLFGGQTLITPISKGSNGAVTSTSTASGQATNLTDKYASIFSSLNPTSSQISTAPVKPIVVSAAPVKLEKTIKPPEVAEKLQDPTLPKPQELEPKAEILVPPRDFPKSTSSTNQDIPIVDSKAETNEMLTQMTKDEWMYLEAELKVLINLGRAVKTTVGTDKEKVDMIEQIDSLQEFFKEAVDISVGQSNEIHCLKQNLIQSWAWFEEANSHYRDSKNEAVALLIKLQPLDSLSQKRYTHIQQLIYFVHMQISQVNKTLDEQWDNFQDFAKKTFKVKMPTMEVIYQTMAKQTVILKRQTVILKDISMRLRKKTNINSLLLSLDKNQDLTKDFGELSLDPQNILQLQYEQIKNHTKNLSEGKARQLRNLLNKRGVTRVTAVKPQVSSWTISQSPKTRMRQSISKLSSSMSPASKSSVIRNLDFAQSPLAKVSEATPPEKSIFAATSSVPSAPNTFVPLVKSGPVISSSQGSAFAPIGGAASSVAKSDGFQQFFKISGSSVPSFSFGGVGVGIPSQASPFAAQSVPTFSSQTLTGTNTSVVTTASNKVTFGLGANTTSVFKPATDSTATVKSIPVSNVAPFGSNAASPKSTFSFTPTTTSNIVFGSNSSSNNFPFSSANSSSIFGSSVNQLNKPTVVSSSAIQLQANSTAPKTQANTSVAVPKTVAAFSVTSSVSVPKSEPADGAASIFANMQSVIDKATSPTTAASSGDNLKPNLPFSVVNVAATTTATQSAFGLPSSTASAAKSLFGSFSSSSSGSLFGNMAKPAADIAPATTAQNVFAVAPTGAASTLGKLAKLTESSETTTARESEHVSETKSPTTSNEGQSDQFTPTSVISVSLFGSKPTTVSSPESVASSTASVLEGNKTTPSTEPSTSIFGNLSVPSTTTQDTPLTFGSGQIINKAKSPPTTPTTTTTATNKSSIFEPPVQTGSIFGSSPITTSSAAANIFASDTVSTTPLGTGSIFGTNVTPASGEAFSSQTASIFGSSANSKSIFGAPATTTIPSTVQFETPTTTTTTSTFGIPATPSAFGTPTPSSTFDTATAKTNIFGSPPTGGSIFGAAPAATTGNIFASPTASVSTAFGSPADTSAKPFGSSAPVTTASSIFGNGTTATTSSFGTQSGSIFGASNASANAFGQPASFGNPPAFGGAQTTTASSIFGQPNVFGSSGPTTSVFGSTTAATTTGSIFGSAVSTSSGFGTGFGTTSTSSAFGSPAATQSSGAFGFGALNMDSGSSSGNLFGGNSAGAFGVTQPATNPFGKAETKPGFGSSSSSIFGNPASTSATTSAFGSPASTTNSVFGSTTGTAFGSSTSGGAFGSPGAFSSPAFGQKPVFGQPAAFGSSTFGSPVGQSGFGAPASFQKPAGGFGSTPVFGGSPTPAFGATSFGGAPSFGSAPTFGSPEKVFGSSGQAAPGGFAAGTQQSTGFGNIASQNTIGFGNLAQQASTPTSMPFSGSSSFSSWR